MACSCSTHPSPSSTSSPITAYAPTRTPAGTFALAATLACSWTCDALILRILPLQQQRERDLPSSTLAWPPPQAGHRPWRDPPACKNLRATKSLSSLLSVDRQE